MATLFARREAKTRIRQRYWLKLDGEKIRREQVGSVPTFLPVRANKFAEWKIGFMPSGLYRYRERERRSFGVLVRRGRNSKTFMTDFCKKIFKVHMTRNLTRYMRKNLQVLLYFCVSALLMQQTWTKLLKTVTPIYRGFVTQTSSPPLPRFNVVKNSQTTFSYLS